MFSRSFVDIRAGVRGTDGRLAVLNPFVPQLGHRLAVRTLRGAGSSTCRAGELRLPARRFVAAVRDGSAVPTAPATPSPTWRSSTTSTGRRHGPTPATL